MKGSSFVRLPRPARAWHTSESQSRIVRSGHLSHVSPSSLVLLPYSQPSADKIAQTCVQFHCHCTKISWSSEPSSWTLLEMGGAGDGAYGLLDPLLLCSRLLCTVLFHHHRPWHRSCCDIRCVHSFVALLRHLQRYEDADVRVELSCLFRRQLSSFTDGRQDIRHGSLHILYELGVGPGDTTSDQGTNQTYQLQ